MTTISSSPTKASTPWLRSLPKCELHLHLEGTISPETLVELSKRHDALPLDLTAAEALYQTHNFLDFLRAFGKANTRLQTVEDYALVTRHMIHNLAAQGVRHAEVYISFGDIVCNKTHLALDAVMAAVESARVGAEAEYTGPASISIYWIVDLIRQHDLKLTQSALEHAIRLREIYPSIVGVGIGGNELAGPAEMFRDIFARALEHGLHVKAHAGESVGPESIRNALAVGAERIGHGVTAVQDPTLVEELRQKQIPLEMCVTSNICTESCASIQEHPIRRFFDEGLLVTINSDDPAMFRSNLLAEYVLLQEQLGFSRQELTRLARNSIIASFLPERRKDELLAELETYAEG